MEEYETLGHMTRATSPGKYIIPHHCVSKVENSKTKIRVVFDASASTHVGSLNDHLHIGPKLQNSIIDIMLNFRRHKIVFTVDLVKMFRQILVHPKDRAYQHVLWRKDLSESVQEYELCTVSYGQASAPYLAIRSIKQLVKDEGSAYPLAAAAVEEDMYVDDLATSSSTIEEALELQQQVIALMSKGEFPLSKWASNHPDLLQVAEDSEVSGLPKRIENPEDRIRFKILGLQWDPVTDRFTYEVSPPEPVFTKRAILASISWIYDPLGLLGPVVITAKAIIQSAWKAKITWDEVLPVHIQDQWRIFLQQLPELRRLEIPRWVANSCPSSYKILIFGDASELAYCATAYLRTSHIGGVEMHLLMSKTKLAPIKVLSIPRLELCAAVLAVKLADQLVNFYRKLPMLPTVYFFTDATIVLGWLNTPAYLLKTFVANRVTRILLTTSTAQWFHVKSADNPSDLGSRGITISSLVGNNLWFHGPDWATQDPSTWPVTSTSTIPQEINGIPELKPACAMVAAPQVNEIYNFICSSSSYLRLIRTVAWMSRFIRNSQLPHSQRSVGALSLQELKGSLLICIKLTQQEGFSHGRSLSTKALPKGLHSLRPFLDDMGLLRVGGRLGKSSLSPQTRTPLILPVKSHLSGLIVDFYHRMFLHPGPSLLLSFLRRKYWIIGARDLVRHYCRNCVSCRRLQAPTCQPLMGDLPVERFQIGRAFLNVGLDFAGPFLIRESLRRKAPQSKCYLCLFICLSSKAIHLEAVSALSTPAFFEAFDRFISRRGLPRVIMSDNGSNFKGAARQLKDWYAQEEVQCRFKDYASHYEIQWKFGPPHAPHFGGIWEAGIRSVKRLLRSAYGEGVFTSKVYFFEELSTMLSRIEAILNSRPMCQLSSDPEDLDALTPGHLLIGGPLIVPPEPLLLGIKETHLARWQIVQQRTQYFWKRWKDEYIHQLQLRNKWRTPERNLQVNDLVLVMGETTDRLSWPLGRVIEIFPGWDGVVRVVSIRTSKTVLKRPVTKLVPILLHDSNFT